MTQRACGFLDLCFWTSEPGAIIIAGLLAAGVAVWGYGWQQRNARADVRASMYGDALRAIEDYAEAPYLVRRRSGKDARAEVSRQISEVQSRLSLSCGLLEVSANRYIAEAFATLVKEARREAGAAMSDAWKSPRIRKDSEMTGQRRYDRSGIDSGRRAFIAAIRTHDRRASRHVG